MAQSRRADAHVGTATKGIRTDKQALVIGGGLAGLMAAEQLLAAGLGVTIAEAKPSFGRKFLMAGKSGLNLTKDEPFGDFGARFYEAAPLLTLMLKRFGPHVCTGCCPQVIS